MSKFVENRVKEIKADKDTNSHYISTTETPANMASRGASTRELNENSLW